MNKANLVVILQGHFDGVPWTNFMLVSENLQTAYDHVSQYVAKGLVLQELKIGQAGRWSKWPVELFTGQSLDAQTQTIQQEWEQILAPFSFFSQLLLQRQAFMRRQLHFFQQQMERLTQKIACLKEALEEPVRFHKPYLNERRMSQLQEQLDSQLAIYSQLQESCRQTSDYLKVLEHQPF